ncbi:retrotransposon gag protein [Cucumis melo var. makuwa]|uniref:Retrotransposon gag protein n=1 Tax=Cucumis melo var. makuwa TaxID=1194695 RepID=A0A5D3BFY2_CUCMM|nr:retrotransposon gag protein [Cucumis melo var. makuwa]TYJ97541.1 retrotransposon gag protein [Cucumis melo var. makuwa]
MKAVEERDHEIVALREEMQTRETTESSQTPVVKAGDKGKNVSYTKRIDNLRMLLGYRPLKLQQANVNGNSKQYITHFIETFENAGSKGDQLVRQFVRSLKENAFEWYKELNPKGTPSTTNVYKLYDVVEPAQHSHRLCRSGIRPALTTASLSQSTLNINNGI